MFGYLRSEGRTSKGKSVKKINWPLNAVQKYIQNLETPPDNIFFMRADPKKAIKNDICRPFLSNKLPFICLLFPKH